MPKLTNTPIGDVELGVVKTENSTKESNLFFFPMPYSDSIDAFLIDLMGTSRTINITGEFLGDKTILKSNINKIETVQNGKQEGITYNGELIETSVQIQTFDWNYNEGDPNRITYSLTLYEGK